MPEKTSQDLFLQAGFGGYAVELFLSLFFFFLKIVPANEVEMDRFIINYKFKPMILHLFRDGSFFLPPKNRRTLLVQWIFAGSVENRAQDGAFALCYF